MGGTCSRPKPVRILFMGLDAAGKTSILYRLKLGELVTTIPTIGFNVETIVHDKVELTSWDVGGRDKIRPLYRHYYQYTDALIYVIDSTDVERLDQALEEMDRYILQEEELKDALIMVLANKQDLEGAVSPDVIEARLRKTCNVGVGISSTVCVMPCSAMTGDGLWHAFDYFVDKVKKMKEGKLQPGLMPQAWLEANQKLAEKKETDDNTKTEDESSGFLSKLKHSLLKNPFDC